MGRGWDLRKELADEKQKELRLARIEELEDEVYDHAIGIVQAAMAFHEVDPMQQDPPPEWVERYGEDAARQRLKVARAGWMPQSLAPMAIKLAAQVQAGIARGRGYKVRLAQNNLNVQISLPAPTSKEHSAVEGYATKEIE